MRRDGRQSGSRDRERAWGRRGTKKSRIACSIQDLGDPTLIPYVYYDQIHIVSARTHILSRHDMLRCDRKPAAHTMVWGSFLQANTLHERPHQPASITPHSGIEELTPAQSFMGTPMF
jgi:hypothetical protein